MDDELPPKLAKIADDYEYNLDHQNDKNRGGKTKKPGKSNLAAIKKTKLYQQEKRRTFHKKKLYGKLKATFLESNFEPHQIRLAIQGYANWLQIQMNQGKEIDIEFEMKRNVEKTMFSSKSGPGGQNINKTATAVRLTHLPTQIKAVRTKERSQTQNLSKAKKAMKEKLQEHLDLWITCFPKTSPSTPKEIIPEFIDKFISNPPQLPQIK